MLSEPRCLLSRSAQIRFLQMPTRVIDVAMAELRARRLSLERRGDRLRDSGPGAAGPATDSGRPRGVT